MKTSSHKLQYSDFQGQKVTLFTQDIPHDFLTHQCSKGNNCSAAVQHEVFKSEPSEVHQTEAGSGDGFSAETGADVLDGNEKSHHGASGAGGGLDFCVES